MHLLLLNVSIKLNQGKFINKNNPKYRNKGGEIFFSAFRGAFVFQTGNVALPLATDMHHNTTLIDEINYMRREEI